MYILAANPFIDAYVNSDFLGRLIFILLVLLSVITWIIVIHKTRITLKAKIASNNFKKKVVESENNILDIDPEEKGLNPFNSIYLVFKSKTIEILEKNTHFARNIET